MISSCSIKRVGDVDVLRLLQLERSTGTLTLEQVTVVGGLLHGDGVDGIALLKHLLRGRVLVDEAGDPRLRSRVLVGLAQTVEDIAGGEGANGDVETALYGCETAELAIAHNHHGIMAIDVTVHWRTLPPCRKKGGAGKRTPKLSFTGSVWPWPAA